MASQELDLDELVENLQTHLVTNMNNNIIAKHPNTIFESEDFNSLTEDVLISIIRLDDLLEEDKIWDYVIQWEKAKNPNLPDLNEWTSDNFLTLKTTLKHCLPHIRYFNFSSEQVVKKLYPYQQLFEPKLLTNPIPSNIITDEHALEISSWIDRKVTRYTETTHMNLNYLLEEVKMVESTREIIGGYSQDRFVFLLKTENLKNSIISRATNFNHAILYRSIYLYLQFGNVLSLHGNLKTGKDSFCGTYYYEKQIRSNTSGFLVEELEVFKVSPKK
ncbi:hypothetical protein Glove_476g85 [Diversispora epigaea]|uniref:BACK domain-containing protein n=1 Tax=Diversispora epigaea TaxID=1348612 RepID=A0A397GKU0_9GLOM|nr:hypothetical protein Glove_476g85 [Diversispora epigaea]